MVQAMVKRQVLASGCLGGLAYCLLTSKWLQKSPTWGSDIKVLNVATSPHKPSIVTQTSSHPLLSRHLSCTTNIHAWVTPTPPWKLTQLTCLPRHLGTLT